MSFLAIEDDESMLNEAFAYIEAYGHHDSFRVGVDLTDGSSDLDDIPSFDDLIEGSLELLDPVTTETQKSSPLKAESSGDQETKNPKTKTKTTKKRRVRSAETSSTGLQRRKRAELASLREQVEELQNVLAQLKHVGRTPLTLQSNSVSELEQSRRTQWHSHAVEQYRLRLQAEKVNRHLKIIMKNQSKVREALCGVLQKRSVLYGMDYLMSHENPTCGAAQPRVSHVDASMARLEPTTERLRLVSNSIFDLNQPATSTNTSMHCKYDELRKAKTIEFETTTHLNYSLEDASNLLWRNFQSERTKGTKPDTLIKKVVLTMPSRKGTISAEKLHFMRRNQDADQTLLTWADVMVLPTKRELQFRTEGIVLLFPSTTNPDQAISRSFLKLYMDINDADCRLRPEDIVYAQDIVLGAMADKLRMYWQSFQNMLIEGTSPTPSLSIDAQVQ